MPSHYAVSDKTDISRTVQQDPLDFCRNFRNHQIDEEKPSSSTPPQPPTPNVKAVGGRRNRKSHATAKEYSCYMCGETFAGWGECLRHLRWEDTPCLHPPDASMKGIQQRCMTSEFKQRGEDRKATLLCRQQAKQAAKKMARKETKAAQKAAMVSLGQS